MNHETREKAKTKILLHFFIKPCIFFNAGLSRQFFFIHRMNLYDDEHPLSKVPNEMDAIINTLIWFDKHLNN